MRLTEDRAARGAHHDPAHLPRDVIELLLNERKTNGIKTNRIKADRIIDHGAAPFAAIETRKLSAASTSRRSRCPIRIVVFLSSMRAGPSTCWPGRNWLPS